MSILVCKQVPDFTAPAVLANGEIDPAFNLAQATKNQYCLIFFYPFDFTFVCPSELIALDDRMQEFAARNTAVVAVSIDSAFTHKAWRNTPISEGGIGQVGYPLVADINHKICQAFGVEHTTEHTALRGAFIIDKSGVVRAQIVNDLPLGRDIDDILRTIDALQYHEKHGEVCPAGWKRGEQAISPTSEGIAKFLAEKSTSL